MTRLRRHLLISGTMAAMSISLLGANLRWAMQVDPLPRPLSLQNQVSETRVDKLAGLSESEILQAVSKAPFQSTRGNTPVGLAVQIPGVAAPQTTALQARLIGTTAFGAGKGIAMVEVHGQPARLFRPGDSIAGFVIKSVERGRLTLQRRDSVVALALEGKR